jgi:signal peptidase I
MEMQDSRYTPPLAEVADERSALHNGWTPNRWLAAALSLFLNPLGMLYVQRPRWAVFYFVLSAAIGVLLLVNAIPIAPARDALPIASSWIPAIVCAVHSFLIARRLEPTTDRRWYSRWYGLIGFPVFLVSIAFFFRSFAYEPFRVPSQSMHPTIREDSMVLVERWGYGNYGTYGVIPFHAEPTREIQRTDMVVFRLVDDPQTKYLMRVIGVPGDRVVYRQRSLSLNGGQVPMAIDSVEGSYQYATETIDGNDVTIALLPARPATNLDVVVPKDHFVVLGDNRDNARDSRFIGLVPRENIVGKVVRVFSSGKGATPL